MFSRWPSTIKRAVWRRFGIALVPEPVFVGFDAIRRRSGCSIR